MSLNQFTPKSKAKTYPVKNVARHTSFTPERREAIIQSVRNRIPYEYAAEANGICVETLYNWMKRGRKDKADDNETEYAVFFENVKKAESARIKEHLDSIAARPKNWQAEAWILERRWYNQFGANAQVGELTKRLDKLEHNGDSTNEGNEAKVKS